MVGDGIHPFGDRDLHQRARVALDVVDADQAHRPEPEPGIEVCDGALLQQREELVERADPRPARLDEAGHALPDAQAVRIRESERAVCVDVDVDEARADVVAAGVDHRGVLGRGSVADAGDPSVLDQHVGNAVDPLGRVDDMPALDNDPVRRIRIIHNRSPMIHHSA